MGIVRHGFATVLAGAAVLGSACGAEAPYDEALSDVDLKQGEGQQREIDISVLGEPELTCGGEVCFFIGSEKNITHVWVRAEGCDPGDFDVEIQGHAAGPSDAGPPDCDGFGGTRYVTGGRNPTSEYFDTVTVCV